MYVDIWCSCEMGVYDSRKNWEKHTKNDNGRASLSLSNISILFERFRSEYIVRGCFKTHNQIMPYWKLKIINFGNTKGCPILILNGEEFTFTTLLSLTHHRKNNINYR